MSVTRHLRRGLLALAAAGLLLAPAGAAGATARTTLPVIERQVMCVTCKIPLNVAESTQADREREFIQSLIDEGEGENGTSSTLSRTRRCQASDEISCRASPINQSLNRRTAGFCSASEVATT